VDIIGMIDVFSEGVNKHALQITITESRENQFLKMLNCRSTNARQVSLCKSVEVAKHEKN